MPDGETDREKLRRYRMMPNGEKTFHANKILSDASADPREWNEETVGVAYILAQLSGDHHDDLTASKCWDNLLTYHLAHDGAADETYVLQAAYQSARYHWRLEDSLGVIEHTQPVYDYWVNEALPTRSSLRLLTKLARIYLLSGRFRNAARLNRRVMSGSLRHGRPLRLIRSLSFQVLVGMGFWALRANPQMEGQCVQRRRW